MFGPRTLFEDRDGSIWAGTGESLVRLQRKGGKAGETSVSNALTALLKREQIVRRERKYRVE